MHLQISDANRAADIVKHWWVEQLRPLDGYPLWLLAVRDMFGWYYVAGTSNFNGILWTMQRELVGSIAIYLVFYAFKREIFRIISGITIGCCLTIWNLEPYYYLCFVAGGIIYLIQRWILALPGWMAGSSFVLGLILGGKPFFVPPDGTFYDWVYRVATATGAEMYIWTLGAILIVFGTLSWRSAGPLMSSRPALFLGRVSFGVYLLHFPLLLALMTNIFVFWGHMSNGAFLVAAGFYIVVVYIAGFIFTILVDEPATRLSRAIKGGSRRQATLEQSVASG